MDATETILVRLKKLEEQVLDRMGRLEEEVYSLKRRMYAQERAAGIDQRRRLEMVEATVQGLVNAVTTKRMFEPLPPIVVPTDGERDIPCVSCGSPITVPKFLGHPSLPPINPICKKCLEKLRDAEG